VIVVHIVSIFALEIGIFLKIKVPYCSGLIAYHSILMWLAGQKEYEGCPNTGF
jgi:hypothetical protein